MLEFNYQRFLSNIRTTAAATRGRCWLLVVRLLRVFPTLATVMTVRSSSQHTPASMAGIGGVYPHRCVLHSIIFHEFQFERKIIIRLKTSLPA